MKILVTENQFKKILRTEDILSKVIKEELEVASDKNLVVVLQQKINDLISNKAKEKTILDGISLKVVPMNGGYTLQVGRKASVMKPMAKGVYALIVKAGGDFTAAEIPMSTIMGEVEKIAEYKSLIEKHPEIKSQVQSGKILGRVYADDNDQGFFKFTRQRTLPDKKEMKYAIQIGQEYPFGEFFERNKVDFKFPDGTFGTLETGNLVADLTSTQIKIAPPQTQEGTTPVQIKPLQLLDSFNITDAEFKDENTTNQQLQLFVQQVKGYVENYGPGFIEQFKAQNPMVLGYTSVDGNPNQSIVGEYKPCSGNRTRKEYDLCLSHERAKKIAEILNKELPELSNAFQPKGMGETTQWGPGWTPQSPTIPETTAANRRIVLNPIQPFTVTSQSNPQPMK